MDEKPVMPEPGPPIQDISTIKVGDIFLCRRCGLDAEFTSRIMWNTTWRWCVVLRQRRLGLVLEDNVQCVHGLTSSGIHCQGWSLADPPMPPSGVVFSLAPEYTMGYRIKYGL